HQVIDFSIVLDNQNLHVFSNPFPRYGNGKDILAYTRTYLTAHSLCQRTGDKQTQPRGAALVRIIMKNYIMPQPFTIVILLLQE
ncbi:MAG: hypothetical protein II085_04275, partial [Alphaproteobacteria bacterium]|nr:hypothetical protein [Alphaproteobacteria bacterium]